MDPTKFIPPDPTQPPVLDLAECRRMVRTAASFERNPGGFMVVPMGVQMKLLLDERERTTETINTANNNAIRYQREAEAANAELTTLRQELIGLRSKLVEQPAPKPKRPGKIVPIEHPPKEAAR